MGAWAYCEDDDCGVSINVSDYEIEDVMCQEYACKHCGLIQSVKHYELTDILKLFNERLCALEEKKGET